MSTLSIDCLPAEDQLGLVGVGVLHARVAALAVTLAGLDAGVPVRLVPAWPNYLQAVPQAPTTA